MQRLLIVGRVRPDAEEQVARIYAEADASELPQITGIRHRSLYRLGDLYIHLIEPGEGGTAGLERGVDHPLFLRTMAQLSAYTSPYLAEARNRRDGMARCFYRWDGPTAELSVPTQQAGDGPPAQAGDGPGQADDGPGQADGPPALADDGPGLAGEEAPAGASPRHAR